MENVHPIFSDHSSDIYGNIIDIKKGKFKRGYFLMGIFYLCVKDGILYKYCNFVWECHNGAIPEDTTIENIDGNKKNNDLKNLQLVSLKINDDEKKKKLKSTNITN